MFNCRPTTAKDLIELIPTLVPLNHQEVAAAGFSSPLDALMTANQISAFAETLLSGGKVVGVFGVTKDGMFWSCLGGGVRPIISDLIAYSKAKLPEILKDYPRLHGYTYVENKFVVRWVKLLGFTVNGPYPSGASGQMFYEFNICA